MSDYILINSDQAMFQPNFGAAIVMVQPGRLRATGKASVGKKKVCIVGDEKSVAVQGCMYTTPAYPVPGVGTLKIASLAGNQQASKTKSKGTKVMLKGGNFQATFEVQTPAANQGSGTTDTMLNYSGQGSFVTTNTKFKGT